MKIILNLLLLLIISTGFSQQTPAPKQTEDFAIVGATAHIGNGEIIENSIIVVSDGKISQITTNEVDKVIYTNFKVIDAKGKHVYPGFIVTNSTLGLVEIDAVKASNDISELGSFNPHIRSLIAYNTESKVVESMRPNGVLIGQIVPRGGRISGTSSVVQFDAWNWEDAVIKADNGIHLNWPSNFTRGRWWLGEDSALKPNENYQKQVIEIENFFNEAKAHNKENNKTHLPFEALNGLFTGTKILFINANDEKSIIDAVIFAKTQGITKLTLVGAYQADKVTAFLKENNVSVLLNRVHSRPRHEDDDYEQPFKLAKKLFNDGILVALESSGRMERMNSRNLPFYAGTTVAYGLTKEQALQLITKNAAEILGISDQYGTLELGKSATLFVSEGDALDMRSNKLTHAFIDGRQISLETHQTKLWRRYSEKYSGNN